MCELSRINWNVNDPKCWRPFFTTKFPMKSNLTVQIEKLEYKTISTDFVKLLEADIEESLMERIRNARPRFITRWNRGCAKILKSFLPKCEQAKINNNQIEEKEHINELSKLLNSYIIYGSPINMRYTDVEDATRYILQLNFHCNEDSKAEFAIACYVHPFVSKICSIWIYFAVLTPKL